MSKITHTQFSAQAAFMAAEAANWAADVLMLPEEHQEPMRDWAMDRFLTKMRERLDRIEKWSKEPVATDTALHRNGQERNGE